MKKIQLIVLCLTLLGFDISAQVAGTGGADFGVYRGRYSIRNRDYNKEATFNKKLINYSPYFNKAARAAEITMLSGKTLKGYYRYNMETESLEELGSEKVVSWDVVKSFTFEETDEMPPAQFSNMKLVWPENEFAGFIQDISTSPFVKVKHYLEYVPSNYDPTTETGNLKDKIVHTEARYLKVDDKWVDLPDVKNMFYNLFGDRSDALRKQARKSKWKYKNTEDVGKMVSWVVKNQN